MTCNSWTLWCVRVEWHDVYELNGTMCKGWTMRRVRGEWHVQLPHITTFNYYMSCHSTLTRLIVQLPHITTFNYYMSCHSTLTRLIIQLSQCCDVWELNDMMCKSWMAWHVIVERCDVWELNDMNTLYRSTPTHHNIQLSHVMPFNSYTSYRSTPTHHNIQLSHVIMMCKSWIAWHVIVECCDVWELNDMMCKSWMVRCVRVGMTFFLRVSQRFAQHLR
jgi:hypothetical protein